MRLPFSSWLPAIPLIKPRVNTIYYLCAKVAQLNLKIEQYQLYPKDFPQLNSAFVYFNKLLSTPLTALALKTRIPPT